MFLFDTYGITKVMGHDLQKKKKAENVGLITFTSSKASTFNSRLLK